MTLIAVLFKCADLSSMVGTLVNASNCVSLFDFLNICYAFTYRNKIYRKDIKKTNYVIDIHVFILTMIMQIFIYLYIKTILTK